MSRIQNPLVAAILAGALILTVARAQETREVTTRDQAKTYEGLSDTGSFQEALDSAIAAAMQAGKNEEGGQISDYMVEWQLDTVTGREGGFAGFNQVKVKIRVGR